MTSENETYRVVEGDPDGPHDKVASARLSKEVAEHGSTVGDNARFIIEPLGKDESLWMADMYDHVAAYFCIDANDFFCGSEHDLLEALATRLSVVPLDCVDYYIVWGKKRSLVVYVSGKLAT